MRVASVAVLLWIGVSFPQEPERQARRNLFGTAILGIGDVDGDGRDDFVVGAARGWGGVWAFSGRTGRLVYSVGDADELGLGQAFCSLDDLDGDGIADFACAGHRNRGLLGRPRELPEDRVRILSARSGSEIRTLLVSSDKPYFLQARSLAPVADLDGDGCRDVLVPVDAVESGVDRVPTPVAVILSTRTGAVVREFTAGADLSSVQFAPRDLEPLKVKKPGAVELVRRTVENVGDASGDGVDDYLVSWGPRGDDKRLEPVVTLMSGWDGEVLRTHRASGPEDPWDYGEETARAGDVDGDGLCDYLIMTTAWWNVVRLHSGATGEVLHRWEGTEERDFGVGLAAVGDVDGDRVPDIAVGMVNPYAGILGKVHVFSGSDGHRLYEIDSRDL